MPIELRNALVKKPVLKTVCVVGNVQWVGKNCLSVDVRRFRDSETIQGMGNSV